MRADLVKILGARGSVPVSGPDYARYGGATSCYFVRLAGQPIVLDAGSGMLSLPAALGPEERRLALLLTHPHADHLLGLPMCGLVFDPACRIDVYAARRGGYDAAAQCRRLISPPLWPVGPEGLPADIRFHDLPGEMEVGPVRVRAMEGVHPGGASLFRLDCGGKSVALVTDCTLTDALRPQAAAFAQGCGLLLCDGQYSLEEWPARASFGHSTWDDAAEFGRLCGAGRTRIVHHDPARTDAELDAAAGALGPGCAFAREGEEILL